MDDPYCGFGLGKLASRQWEFRPLLMHPRIKALLVKQGAWLRYLAECVPEYAEFKTSRYMMHGDPRFEALVNDLKNNAPLF